MKSKEWSWDKLIREIKKANKDPAFVRAVKRFINVTSNEVVYRDV